MEIYGVNGGMALFEVSKELSEQAWLSHDCVLGYYGEYARRFGVVRQPEKTNLSHLFYLATSRAANCCPLSPPK